MSNSSTENPGPYSIDTCAPEQITEVAHRASEDRMYWAGQLVEAFKHERDLRTAIAASIPGEPTTPQSVAELRADTARFVQECKDETEGIRALVLKARDNNDWLTDNYGLGVEEPEPKSVTGQAASDGPIPGWMDDVD